MVLGAGFRGLLAQAVIIVPRLGMSLNTQKNAEISGLMGLWPFEVDISQPKAAVGWV